MDEEQVIADGLMKVREGILGGLWQAVCEGYNSISGEDLKPPGDKPKSKLENIRAAMAANKPKDADKVIDFSRLKTSELNMELRKRGKTAKDLRQKTKAQLISMIKDIDEEAENTEEEDNEEKEDESEGVIELEVKKFKGGKAFAQKGFEVIQSVADPDEKEKNEKIAKRAVQLGNYQRKKPPRDQSSDEEASVRYKDKPSTPPPWSS